MPPGRGRPDTRRLAASAWTKTLAELGHTAPAAGAQRPVRTAGGPMPSAPPELAHTRSAGELSNPRRAAIAECRPGLVAVVARLISHGISSNPGDQPSR